MNNFRVYTNNTDAGIFAAENESAAINAAGANNVADSYAVQIVCDEEVYERDEAGTPVHFRGEDGLEYDFR